MAENSKYGIRYHASIYSRLSKNFNYKSNMLEIFISRIEELKTKKTKLQIELDKIAFLSETSYKILVYRCINNLSWDQIVQKTEYSKSSCFRSSIHKRFSKVCKREIITIDFAEKTENS